MDAAEMLMQFALTRQEALIYMALTTDGAMTGYEVAKQLGISRSNCYTSLASLVEKGAAYLLEDTATRYVAVKPEEFCGNRIRMLEELKDKEYEFARFPGNPEANWGPKARGSLKRSNVESN